MSEDRRRRIRVEDVADIAVVRFIDRRFVDVQNIILMGEQLFALVDQDHRSKILLNLEGVEYISSDALAKFIGLNKKARGANAQLRLCCVDRDIYEVFEITRLNKVFPIYDDQEAALEAFNVEPIHA
jgi:anti-sigma B factor antagonist